MANGERTLRRAVRPAVVAKYLGQLSLVLALLNLVPLAVSIYFAEYHISWRFLLVISVLLLVTRAARLPTPAELQRNEAMVIVALAFIISPLLMVFPMSGAGLSYSEAWFEAVSGVTTTGLSTLASVEGQARTFLFSRAWMQWYGGLGIVVLTIALLTSHHVASRRLTNPARGEGLATTRTYARRMLSVYIALTLAAVAALVLSGVDGFIALTHSLSAVSTGGFSPFDESLAAMPSMHQAFLVIVFGLLGAVPFHLYFRARHGNLLASLRDPELLTLLALAAVTAACLTLILHRGAAMGWADAAYHGAAQGISALSTSGFSTLNIAQLGDDAKLTLILAMLTGGGVGSTAGGIKVFRLLILLRVLQVLLRRTALPNHAVLSPRLAGHVLESNEIQNALLLILLFIVVILISWALFILHDYPPMDALFEVVSATATVGLSTGITGPDLQPMLKQVLVVDMLFGRLEIVALLVLLYPPTWFGKRVEA